MSKYGGVIHLLTNSIVGYDGLLNTEIFWHFACGSEGSCWQVLCEADSEMEISMSDIP